MRPKKRNAHLAKARSAKQDREAAVGRWERRCLKYEALKEGANQKGSSAFSKQKVELLCALGTEIRSQLAVRSDPEKMSLRNIDERVAKLFFLSREDVTRIRQEYDQHLEQTGGISTLTKAEQTNGQKNASIHSTATDKAAPAAASAASSSEAAAPASSAPAPPPRKKKSKKRKDKSSSGNVNEDAAAAPPARKKKKGGRRGGSSNQGSNNNARSGGAGYYELPALSEAQLALNEQMRRALEEEQYSARGSIVDTATDSEDDEAAASVGPANLYRGAPVRLDRAALQQAIRKHNLLERLGAARKPSVEDDDDDDDGEEEDDDMDDEHGGSGPGEDPATASSLWVGAATAPNQKKKKTRSSSKETGRSSAIVVSGGGIGDGKVKRGVSSAVVRVGDPLGMGGTSSGDAGADDYLDRDAGSIFGQNTGSGNSTWVECDKCKKWRRLRGVVDEKKLPSKWYCSMNKNDPERARCSAPEEEYETQHTPDSAADARTRKHLRVWVRRLRCNDSYEARQPTLTRGAAKKRASTSSSKDPYEWVRCCNAACGKWRACLRTMDAKNAVIDRCAPTGEWYCVMNTWDEKLASCAAPQESLPAVGNLPAWVMQDDHSS